MLPGWIGASLCDEVHAKVTTGSRLALCAAAVSLAAISPANATDNLKPPTTFASGWSFDASIDGLYGRRNHSDAIIIQDTVTTATVLSGDNFSFDNKGGV